MDVGVGDVGHSVPTIESEPPIKRRRGRPKKKAVSEVSESASTQKSGSEPKVVAEMNRFAGRMSLRPNRRVDVRKGSEDLFNLIFLAVRDGFA